MKIDNHLLFVILIIITSCNQPSSKEEVSDSTQLPTDTVVSRDRKSVEPVTEPEPVLIIADSTANALNALVNSKFSTLFQALADSSNYYKVQMEDYFDEYEGQAEMQKYIWYFDKEFSIVYSKYSYENGAMFKPDVTEYFSRNDSLICTIETSFVRDEDKSITVWDIQKGGVKLNWSRYSNKIETVESIVADYGKNNEASWDVNLNALKSTLAEEEPITGDEEIYIISIRKPKHAELVDYKEVIIPKAVYDKLKP